jgi:hypothetical protein
VSSRDRILELNAQMDEALIGQEAVIERLPESFFIPEWHVPERGAGIDPRDEYHIPRVAVGVLLEFEESSAPGRLGIRTMPARWPVRRGLKPPATPVCQRPTRRAASLRAGYRIH